MLSEHGFSFSLPENIPLWLTKVLIIEFNFAIKDKRKDLTKIENFKIYGNLDSNPGACVIKLQLNMGRPSFNGLNFSCSNYANRTLMT